MITKKDLEDRIKEKFGKKSRFARLAGIGPYELQKMFAKKVMDPDHINLILKGLEVENQPQVDPDKMAKLKNAIDDAGGCYTFCKNNAGFPMRLTYMIYNGEQKRESKLFKKLLIHFGIEEKEE